MLDRAGEEPGGGPKLRQRFRIQLPELLGIGGRVGEGFSFLLWYGWKETGPGIDQRFLLGSQFVQGVNQDAGASLGEIAFGLHPADRGAITSQVALLYPNVRIGTSRTRRQGNGLPTREQHP